MAVTSLTFKLFGQDVSAGKTMRDVGKTAGGVAAGMGAAWGASKLADFAKDSINAFQDLGRTTMGLKRFMGGSAEEASRLAHAFAMTGTDSGVATKSLGILSKHLAANDKSAQGMGVAYRDASGKMLPMHDVLMGLSERFSKMPDGAEKTALAMSTLGKGGAAMIPFLNKGAEGIRQLEEESDSLGTTLSGKDLDAVKENTAAKRKFGEAVKGLQVSIGRELYPIITKLAEFLSNNVVPIFRTVVEWLKENKTAVSSVVGIIGVVVAGFKVWTLVMTIFNAVVAANPISLIVLAIAALVAALVLAYQKVDWFRNFIDAAFTVIKTVVGAVVDFFTSYVWPVIKFIFEAWWLYVSTLWKVISTVFGWIWNVAIQPFVNWFQQVAWPIIKMVIDFIVAYYTTLWNVVKAVFSWIWKNAIEPFVKWFQQTAWPIIQSVIGALSSGFTTMKNGIVAVWNTVKEKIDWAWDKIKGPADSIRNVFSGMWSGVGSAASNALQAIKNAWNDTIGGRDLTVPGTDFGIHIPKFLAQGGIVTRATSAIIGEAGPEAVIPLSQMNKFTGGGSGGGDIHIHVSGVVAGSADNVARELSAILRDGVARGVAQAAW